jgi:hypothetical protein
MNRARLFFERIALRSEHYQGTLHLQLQISHLKLSCRALACALEDGPAAFCYGNMQRGGRIARATVVLAP